jgi:hypothetical protein
MIHDGDRLAGLSNAMVMQGGDAIAFRVERRDGQSLDVVCDLVEVGDIFSFLGTLAKAAASEQETESATPSRSDRYLAPIPASGIGFQPGPGVDETMIVMRLNGFDVAFAVPNSGLVALADDIARIARTLSANHQKPQ